MIIVETFVLFRRSLICQVRQFFDNSTLHGVKYITARNSSIVFRFVWFCLTTIATVSALIIIFSLWEKFQTEPTITGLDGEFNSTAILFPTVAVCPHNNHDDTKLEQFANSLAMENNVEVETMISLLQLLSSLSFDNIAEANNLTNIIDITIFENKTLREIAFEMQPSCEQLFSKCKFRNLLIECCENFRPIYTESGFCFAFNSQLESIKEEDIELKPKHYLLNNDLNWGLYVQPKFSATIYVYSFYEYLISDFHTNFVWRENLIMDLRILQRIFYASDDTRSLSVSQSNCIFANDENLILTYYPKQYIMTACIKNCRIQMALSTCKCIPSFYKQVATERMCDFTDFHCLIENRANITSLENCLYCKPNCRRFDVSYEQISKQEEKDIEKCGFEVSFLSWPSYRYKMGILFGWVDLLGAFGGIASLFIGFSLLSGVEIIYYFTMRACCMLHKNRQKLYEMEQRLTNRPPPCVDLSLEFKRISTANERTAIKCNTEEQEQYKRFLVNRRLKTEKIMITHSKSQFQRAFDNKPFLGPSPYGTYLP